MLFFMQKHLTDNECNSNDDSLPLYVSAAMDINRGIGVNGTLPWSLK